MNFRENFVKQRRQCCISYKNQSFAIKVNQSTGFYLKCFSMLKLAGTHSDTFDEVLFWKYLTAKSC